MFYARTLWPPSRCNLMQSHHECSVNRLENSGIPSLLVLYDDVVRKHGLTAGRAMLKLLYVDMCSIWDLMDCAKATVDEVGKARFLPSASPLLSRLAVDP